MIIGCDLGNKSTNGLALMDNTKVEILESKYIRYDGKPYFHRREIVSVIREWIKKYNLGRDDYILFEKINLYRGGYISKLSNIVSLAFLQATLINEFSTIISISEVNVQTWKSKILKSKTATKDDAVRYVELRYPNVDLNLTIKHRKKPDEIVKCHDLADACCIAEYGARCPIEISQNEVNYS